MGRKWVDGYGEVSTDAARSPCQLVALLIAGSWLLVPERGSGAFRRPVKQARERLWRHRKCEC